MPLLSCPQNETFDTVYFGLQKSPSSTYLDESIHPLLEEEKKKRKASTCLSTARENTQPCPKHCPLASNSTYVLGTGQQALHFWSAPFPFSIVMSTFNIPLKTFPFSLLVAWPNLLICLGMEGGSHMRCGTFNAKPGYPSTPTHHQMTSLPITQKEKIKIISCELPQVFLPLSSTWTYICAHALPSVLEANPIADSQLNSSSLWCISPLFNTSSLQFQLFFLFPLIQLCASLFHLQKSHILPLLHSHLLTALPLAFPSP